jgi:hypothetical protein
MDVAKVVVTVGIAAEYPPKALSFKQRTEKPTEGYMLLGGIA